MDHTIAIMADMHSNYEAFKTCLRETEKSGITDYIFLGDYLGDMAYPRKTMDLIYELDKKYHCLFIRSNKENYWIQHRQNPDEIWEIGRSGTGLLAYIYSELTDSDIDFFEQMPITSIIRYDGYPAFEVCHGSPFKVNQSLRSDLGYIDELLPTLQTDLTICGHFHIQMDYTRLGKRVINPGAVGIPVYSVGEAQFMILNGHDGKWEPELLSIPFCVEQSIREMKEAGLDQKAPGWYTGTKHLLLKGEPSLSAILRRVVQLHKEDTGVELWQNIPEAYWAIVQKELEYDMPSLTSD